MKIQLQFNKWLENFDEEFRIKIVADKWFRTDGSAKTRSMTETMIFDTMKSYNLSLSDAARLMEKAILYYKDEHVVGGAEAYWSLVKKMQEMVGTGAIVSSCQPTADYQVWGACSDGKAKTKRRRRKKQQP